jgi:hypothetical protein
MGCVSTTPQIVMFTLTAIKSRSNVLVVANTGAVEHWWQNQKKELHTLRACNTLPILPVSGRCWPVAITTPATYAVDAPALARVHDWQYPWHSGAIGDAMARSSRFARIVLI